MKNMLQIRLILGVSMYDMGVTITPGEMVFALIPYLPYFMANDFV